MHDCGGRAVGFFFQAEDGIRDHCVTGVQTCALPISALTSRVRELHAGRAALSVHEPDDALEHLNVIVFPDAEIVRADARSEERRVGKECRFRWSAIY